MLDKRGALRFFASKLAPTGIGCCFHLRDQVSHPFQARLSPPPIRVYACSHSGPFLAYATVAVAPLKFPVHSISFLFWILSLRQTWKGRRIWR
ncbi:hypothetical protein DXU77_04570 [Pseudomonas lactis]|nr:hypothetical protein [Pseudomonas lactis]